MIIPYCSLVFLGSCDPLINKQTGERLAKRAEQGGPSKTEIETETAGKPLPEPKNKGAGWSPLPMGFGKGILIIGANS